FVVLREPRRISPEFHGVFLWRELTTASPRFVPHSPVLHIERLHKAGCRASIGQSCASGRRIAILHPLLESRSRQAPHVRGKIGFGADELTEVYKLVGPDPVRIV